MLCSNGLPVGGPWTSHISLTWKLVRMQILGLQPRLAESETLRGEPRPLCVTQPCRWCSWTLKSEHHSSSRLTVHFHSAITTKHENINKNTKKHTNYKIAIVLFPAGVGRRQWLVDVAIEDRQIHLFIHSFIQSFTQYLFSEHCLCARHDAREQ